MRLITIGLILLSSSAALAQDKPDAELQAYRELLTEANGRVAAQAKTIDMLQSQLAKARETTRLLESLQKQELP